MVYIESKLKIGYKWTELSDASWVNQSKFGYESTKYKLFEFSGRTEIE